MKLLIISPFVLMVIFSCSDDRKKNSHSILENSIPRSGIKTSSISGKDSSVLSNTKVGKKMNKSDSLILNKYIIKMKKEIIGMDLDSTLSINQIDSMLNLYHDRFTGAEIIYSSDSALKIFQLEGTTGGYGDSYHRTYIHYNLKSNEKVKEMDFGGIDLFYKLSTGKYLIIEYSIGRPAATYGQECYVGELLSILDNDLKIEPIKYKNRELYLCQRTGILENEIYVRYDHINKTLNYSYGVHYEGEGINCDSIWQGQFKYINGNFTLLSENATVIDYKLNEK